jgi:DNA-binding transcriptional LysR family regulator
LAHFNIRQVEAFRAVVTLGSMTKAAEVLGISQPAVSRLIVDFEHAVGLHLFSRQRGGAEPTDDGRMLFVQVEKLFVGLEELNHQVAAIKSLATGMVSIVAMDIYANGLLPEIIGAFSGLFPYVSIRLESQPQDRVADWVASHRADLGFATLPLANTTVPALRLLERPALCVMQTDHPLALREHVLASDLAGLPFVSFMRGTPFRYETDALFEKVEVERILLTEAMTHEAVCGLVSNGLGVSIVSPFSPHLGRNPQLTFRPFRPAIPVAMGVLGNVTSLSSAALTFFNFVVEELSRRAIGAHAADGTEAAPTFATRKTPSRRKEARS